ncbi:hypothetical protein EVB32_351 [Rhizobium phage RHph_TM39]|uniref:Uncharacterized protein n=2 Tax=Cuauhnahuacvirus TaxID=3044696 RepID=A0A7S5R8G9_9CAUD|nr:hypothetical protein PQC16_gp285 [Rhizobium phage RHph_TM30]YP_010671504.1 hypothetical protein PQC17_gp286 [Rhizobium phage RHph_Y65]QIG71826.1 hypothetical protein EVB94_375 [Rhizobium phage RHph_TM40]QIG72187.1 hypothetical protein EVB95_374 [Rhizobium phage RHph_TM2_3B]QIG72550.1 hypothetical protein EVB96_374 [Rhizobium phage RHph_TM3_3_6]QIG77319.1 hypothetical protein EVB32_351 [Rhizobium phage RHph_TM39]QIG77579.1 hypothetical protein EVB61_273 [Rhizobium phage RHph_TM21B]QIG77934
MSRSSELLNKVYPNAIVEDDEDTLDAIAIACENIVDSMEDAPEEIEDWVADQLASVDDTGELGIYDCVVKMSVEDAQSFYETLKSKLDDAGVSYTEEVDSDDEDD